MSPSPVLFVVVFCCFLVIRFCLVRYRRGIPLPPGPTRYPVIGSLLCMPKTFEWETYYRWATELESDVIHVPVLGANLIVLNSPEAVDDLLEKRSAIYASRPRMPMLLEVMKFTNFSMQPYGDYWKECRRLCHRELHPATIKRFHPTLMKYTHMFLRSLIQTPNDWRVHLRHLTGASMLAIAYGLDIKPTGDPYIDAAQMGMRGVEQAVIPGAFLVDMLPWLKYIPAWFPGAGFKRKAKTWREVLDRMNNMPFAAAKEEMAKGGNGPSYVGSCLENIDPSEDIAFQEKIIKETAGTMYAGNSDTTAAALASFVLAMLDHPEIMRKAQADIDRVIGTDRLPTIDDADSLPYISAIVKETLRWSCVTPISIPHLLTQDDTYRGYFLPAGSIVIPNTWAVLHDEGDYPDAFTFNPDRFMKDGQLNSEVKDPIAAFGYGRRICPGRFIAADELFIGISSILAAFEITKPIGLDGETIEPSHEIISGALCTPAPFECTIKPRNSSAEKLVIATEDWW